jgi:hypothetical protein
MLAGLRGTTLRVPPNAKGVIVTLRLEARVRMPSGAEPGKNGVPKYEGLSVGGEFDLGDIGAKPQRTVHTSVVSEQVL